MRSKLVIRYLDGRLLKGSSPDLFPNKLVFHLTDAETETVQEVQLSELKAIFYVKEYVAGDRKSRRYDVERSGLGRRVRVQFKDGEVIEGYTNGYSPDRLAFYVFPPDPEDNTDRILVVTRATAQVKLL
jgi:hypothetical protein